MATYLISYDLSAPGRNYNALYEAIKSYGTYSHSLESVWIVKTDRSTGDVRDHLKQHLDSNDKLLVIEVTKRHSWRNLRSATGEWLKKYL